MQSPNPSIVFVHGIWADRSSFGKLIPALQAEGCPASSCTLALDMLGLIRHRQLAHSRACRCIDRIGHRRGDR
jgi:hypothetical protein